MPKFKPVPAVPSLKEYVDIRTRRLALQHEADILKQQEDLALEYLIALSNSNGLLPIVDPELKLQLVVSKTEEPQTNDWPALLAHIRATGEVDLLEKRVLKSAVKLRWADKIQVPGVGSISKFSTVLKEA
jgi:hypothetical protein